MAYFAKIDDSNIVIEVTVISDTDTQDKDGNIVDSIGEEYMNEGFGGTWKRTDKETRGNKHKKGGTPFRKNYAGIGYIYDVAKDAFYLPQPFPSWILDEDTCLWEAPVAYPTDGKHYAWNEATTTWKLND